MANRVRLCKTCFVNAISVRTPPIIISSDKFDELVKSPRTVMPDPESSPGQVLIQYPEVIGFTGFRLPDQVEYKFHRNDVLKRFSTFYELIKFKSTEKNL